MKLARISFLFAMILVAASSFAQSRRIDESIRLRNWKPSTEKMRAFAAAVSTTPLNFVAMQPCRIVDTRGPAGPYGSPTMLPNVNRSFDLNDGPCAGIPANVAAYSLNVAVANPSAQGNLRVWPTGEPKPEVANMNFRTGINLSNAVLVAAGTVGSIDVAVTAQTDVIIDINGYFIAGASSASTVRVTPASLGQWVVFNDLCGLPPVEFTNGEAVTPPLGTGSFQVNGTDGDGAALATEAYDGMLVGDLTTLRFSTKSQEATDQPYIYINIDDNGDSVRDRTIYFFPANNSAQGPVKADTWQSWNGITGQWNIDGDGGPGVTVPFSTFASSHILGVRFASGCGGTTGGVPRARNTDEVVIGTGGNAATTFDFEKN